ncbi:MAG: glycosyltransferase, partial [Proteobacteria bacterium]|nr:glycosyltransferase [Pseudomonadota bacterium]
MNPKGDILYVASGDQLGGAARVCWNLFEGVLAQGLPARLLVKNKRSTHPKVERIDPCVTPDIARPGLTDRGLGPVGQLAARMGLALGLEDWYFPRSHQLVGLAEQARLVHCHNLHEGYFDLRILPRLSHAVPLILTLHDAWLLAGHCAHSLGCHKWTTGCLGCPDPQRYPALRRDGACFNWLRRRRLFSKSRLHIATPCQWLMDKVQRSILEPGVVEARVIPLGIDLDLYRPKERKTSKETLGLPKQSVVVLFAAAGLKNNIWKDYDTFTQSLERIAAVSTARIVFVALGADEPPQQLSRTCELRFVPFINSDAMVAHYFQAADIYLHAARADTFPNAVLEALACAVPVVASAVGGIPEQVRSLVALPGLKAFGPAEATGILVPEGNAEAMAEAVLL